MGNYSQISKGQWDSMASRITSYIVNRKYLIAPICMIGIVVVAYGMVKDNSLIFIIGLVFVIGGYLLIRRRMKESIRSNS
jgi:LPXTG-motif cell wall-anchored protein